jgi:hypothetical protein
MDKLDDTDEFSALQHWSTFGQKGAPPAQRVISSNWKTNPFEQPVTGTWDQSIPREELPKILVGFLPGPMDDKWFVYADGPDAQGNGTLHMHRSWTGDKIIQANFAITLDGDGKFAERDAHFTSITWESSGGLTEAEAKDMAKEVCNWCMDVKLP